MSNDLNPLQDRFQELAVAKVTEGLSEMDQREFDTTDWTNLGADPERELAEFEAAAAAAMLAFESSEPKDELPSDLREKMMGSAKVALAGTQKVDASGLSEQYQATLKRQRESAPASSSSPAWREGLAWLVAAACLGFALFGMRPDVGPDPTPTIETVPTLDEQYTSFVENAPTDMHNLVWTQVHSESAGGNIVWSDTEQKGFMVLDNLKINDPTVEQYQLWIFDTDPKQDFPVDGGVFDITKDGKVIVPIDAKIAVDKAVQFAVTIEKPGGVVVSKRERIPVLAKIKGLE